VAVSVGTCTEEHEAGSRMQSTMESQVVAATELESSHGSHVAAVEAHTEHYLKEEYSVRFGSDTMSLHVKRVEESVVVGGCVVEMMGLTERIHVPEVGACGTCASTRSHSGRDGWMEIFVVQEDRPTCSTPRRRAIQVPAQSSINGLCTPPLDMLLNEFRAKNAGGGPDRLSKVFPTMEASFRDSRTPLIAIN